ncbi:MAG: hypothetical protein AMXMBFR84_49370 [Candidatus Hydrogenedentota bacterium]
MQASPTYNLHTRNIRLPLNRPICAHRRSSADKTPRRTRTSAQSLFSTGFWQTADIDDIRFTGSNLKTTTTFTCNNANELTSMTMTPGGTTTFTYDDWGRMTQKANGSFTADYAYRYGSMLYNVDSDFPGEGEVTYEYSASKQRRVRVANSQTTVYRWHRGRTPLCEDDGAGELTRLYLLDRAGHVDGNDPAASDYTIYVHDHLGSIRSYYDDSSEHVGSSEFAPFGSYFSATASQALTKSFGGIERESQSGAHLAFFRSYDSVTTRWMTRDPLSMIDGPNMYGYVRSNPIMRTDKYGLGDLIVAGNCTDLTGYSYVPESYHSRDGDTTLPVEAGETYDVDAVYGPNGAVKVPNNATCKLRCGDDGRPSALSCEPGNVPVAPAQPCNAVQDESKPKGDPDRYWFPPNPNIKKTDEDPEVQWRMPPLLGREPKTGNVHYDL